MICFDIFVCVLWILDFFANEKISRDGNIIYFLYLNLYEVCRVYRIAEVEDEGKKKSLTLKNKTFKCIKKVIEMKNIELLQLQIVYVRIFIIIYFSLLSTTFD